jgi:hypothetical protein
MLNQDQVVATRKANIDLLFGLSSSAVEGIEKLAALNVQLLRATLSDTFDVAQKSFSVKVPRLFHAARRCAGDHLVRWRQVHSVRRHQAGKGHCERAGGLR